MYQRSLKPSKLNSFFLFGARATGKTTLLHGQGFLDSALRFDLLDPELEARFALNPQLLWEQSSKLSPGDWVVIDEVQKVPKLLSLVHKIIEEKKVNFALTGSSARKLKRGGADMLAGRAFVFNLFPLTYKELTQKGFDLLQTMHWGSLPKILSYADDIDRIRYLNAYVHTYIKEEIQVEQLVRNLDPFRLFLKVAAQNNGEIINYSNITKDTGVDIKSVQNYYEILRDTHLGFLLEPFGKSVRKVQKKSPKFYFFDGGVKRAIADTLRSLLNPGTYDYGSEFESWFINECYRESHYRENGFRLSFLRTKDDAEIDLIIERPNKKTVFLEIKSTDKVDERHFRHLKNFQKDFPNDLFICASRDSMSRNIGGIEALHWKDAFEAIFS